MDSVEKELLNGDANRSRTENGALGYRTTGKNLLDLNFQTSSLRKKQPDEIVGKYVDAFLDNKLYALKWLFYLRDAREGLGERRSFRIIMNHLAKTEPNIAKALVTLIPEYGRYDDLMCLFGTECEVFALAVIKEQLKYITFGSRPKVVDLTGMNSLRDKLIRSYTSQMYEAVSILQNDRKQRSS